MDSRTGFHTVRRPLGFYRNEAGILEGLGRFYRRTILRLRLEAEFPDFCETHDWVKRTILAMASFSQECF